MVYTEKTLAPFDSEDAAIKAARKWIAAHPSS